MDRKDKLLLELKLIEIINEKPERKEEWLRLLRNMVAWWDKHFKCSKCNSKDLKRTGEYLFKCNKCGVENIIFGFTTFDLRTQPHLMVKLRNEGFLEVTCRTRRETDYLPVNADIEIFRDVLKYFEEEMKKVEVSGVSEEEIAVPDDLFRPIVGYKRLKKIIKMSLESKEPVHILLVGPPSSAKSMILHELNRIRGSYLVLAGTTSKAGLRDILLEDRPRILLIDELDKIKDTKDLSVLLSFMEHGLVKADLATKRAEVRYKGWVIAAANTIRGIKEELLSRFLVIHLKPYTKEEVRKIIVTVLTEREGKSKELAEYIAEKVVEELNSRDPRDGIKVGRLAKTKEEVDFVVDFMKKTRPSDEVVLT